MYIFVDSKTIIPYDDEILKRYVGKKLIKTISNPTNEQLTEFGYMELVDSEMPNYNVETQYPDIEYIVENGKIKRVYIIKDIENNILERE